MKKNNLPENKVVPTALEKKENKFLTSDFLKNTRHYFAFSTPFELKNYNDVSPKSRPEKEFKKLIKGSIYRHNGRLVKHAEIDCNYGGKYVYPINSNHLSSINYAEIAGSFFSKETDIIAGKTLYLGNWMGHYGHFIIENLSRLWDIEKAKSYDSYAMHPFIFDNNLVKLHGYQSYLLELLGIKTEKFKPIYKKNVFKSLDVPEQGWIIAGPVNSKSKKIYEKIHKLHNKSQIYKKIFLSRKQDKMIRIKNIDKVNDFFKFHGYEIVYPEEINIKKQLELYSNAEVLAGFSGSGLHNSIFSNQETLIVELGDIRSPNKPMKVQVAAIELTGQRHFFIPYNGTEDGHYNSKYLNEFMSILKYS